MKVIGNTWNSCRNNGLREKIYVSVAKPCGIVQKKTSNSRSLKKSRKSPRSKQQQRKLVVSRSDIHLQRSARLRIAGRGLYPGVREISFHEASAALERDQHLRQLSSWIVMVWRQIRRSENHLGRVKSFNLEYARLAHLNSSSCQNILQWPELGDKREEKENTIHCPRR